MTWPEFRLILLMRNEHDSVQHEQDLARAADDDPAAAGVRDPRLGRPPPQEELDVLPTLE